MSEYSKWVHSVNFDSINTWDDWHLVPMSRPVINPPTKKTVFVDIPGADGRLDLSEVVSGGPVYNNRTGSIEFMVQNGFKPWSEMFSTVMNALHGKYMNVSLDDDPEWHYRGLISVSKWTTGDHYSTITIDYDLEPYKYNGKDKSL